MFYGEDHDGVTEIVEADAVIADAEAELWRFDVLESLDIAFAGGEITSHDMQDAERGGLVDSAEVGLGLVGPAISSPSLLALAVRVKRGAAHALEIFGGEAELGEDILVRNRFVVLEPGLGGSNSAGLFLADRFVLKGSVGETAGQRIEHSFEQADDGGELRRGKPVDQFVGVLFVGHESSILTQKFITTDARCCVKDRWR